MRLLPMVLAAPLALGIGFQAPAMAAEPLTIIGAAAPMPAAEEEPDDTPPVDTGALAWRHGQLQVHQALGLATLGSMAATGALGYWLSQQNGTSGVFDGHLLAAGLTTGLYLTSATMALTVPPHPLQRKLNPWDSTELHKNIGWLHAAGMTSTITLGLLTTYNSLTYTHYHGYAAYATLGLMALSAGVIAFGE